ncbi:hypothetical protein DRN97_04175 [Methanosarcinales archaeon]|nr:MAG: hypothetical protein DRN97_04175 [Methanosarcinales archaeon]
MRTSRRFICMKCGVEFRVKLSAIRAGLRITCPFCGSNNYMGRRAKREKDIGGRGEKKLTEF